MDKVAFPGPIEGRVGHPDLTHFVGQTPPRNAVQRALIDHVAAPTGAERRASSPDRQG
jgi:hypothetical protein